ncbi:hypothetical protein [Thermus sediminis]|uniref:hypothetical protein n=1 Tax=Thermus sediminis TaxID=1761908 RepID=UPI000E3B8102|nr:hypothetical protein [Thermus sediminis]
MWPPYHKARPLPVFYREASTFFDPLAAAIAANRLPLFPYPVEALDPWEALPCLRPLDFAGMVLEEALAPPEGVRLEAEAQEAGRVDLVVAGAFGLLGHYTEGLALERFLSAAFPGAKALWLGPLRAPLAPFLRALGRVSVAAGSFAEGDGFLARLPERARGHVALRPEEVHALALKADLVIFAGGRLPLSLLQPFHTLLALAPVERGVRERVLEAHGPEEVWDFRTRAVLEGLGYAL